MYNEKPTVNQTNQYEEIYTSLHPTPNSYKGKGESKEEGKANAKKHTETEMQLENKTIDIKHSATFS